MSKLLIHSLFLAAGLTLFPTVAQAGKNRIVELKGDAQIRLAGATNEQPASTGMTLILGDILIPDAGTEVIVNCSDGTLGKAQAGVPSGLKAICPSAKSTDPRGEDNIFLDLLQGEFTYQTLLLSENSLLSWSPVSGVNQYRVKVKAGEAVIWEKIVEGTSVRYQGEPLRPKFYDLVVEGIKEDELPLYQLKIRLVNPVIAEDIRKKVAAIEEEEVGEEAQALMLADLYRKEQQSVTAGFLLTAIEPLEKLVESDNKTPVVYRLLGDIYLRLGRGQEASEIYQKALLIAEAYNNLSEIALAKVGLAHVAVSEGKFLEATRLLEKAIAIYQLMEDEQRLDLIQGWLNELEKK